MKHGMMQAVLIFLFILTTVVISIPESQIKPITFPENNCRQNNITYDIHAGYFYTYDGIGVDIQDPPIITVSATLPNGTVYVTNSTRYEVIFYDMPFEEFPAETRFKTTHYNYDSVEWKQGEDIPILNRKDVEKDDNFVLGVMCFFLFGPAIIIYGIIICLIPIVIAVGIVKYARSRLKNRNKNET